MGALLKLIKELKAISKKKNELNGLYCHKYHGDVMGTTLEGWKRK